MREGGVCVCVCVCVCTRVYVCVHACVRSDAAEWGTNGDGVGMGVRGDTGTISGQQHTLGQQQRLGEAASKHRTTHTLPTHLGIGCERPGEGDAREVERASELGRNDREVGYCIASFSCS